MTGHQVTVRRPAGRGEGHELVCECGWTRLYRATPIRVATLSYAETAHHLDITKRGYR